MSKILKCAGNDDSLTLKAADDADSIQFLFESPSACPPAALSAAADTTPAFFFVFFFFFFLSFFFLILSVTFFCAFFFAVFCAENDKISDFDLKLMEIESDSIGIPETDYKATVNMPSAELQRICRDLSVLGDTVTIAVTKEGVKFSVTVRSRARCASFAVLCSSHQRAARRASSALATSRAARARAPSTTTKL